MASVSCAMAGDTRASSIVVRIVVLPAPPVILELLEAWMVLSFVATRVKRRNLPAGRAGSVTVARACGGVSRGESIRIVALCFKIQCHDAYLYFLDETARHQLARRRNEQL